MKFFFFHLMPYSAIDPDFLDHNASSWITLPNSYYDPKKGAKLYHRYLDELDLPARKIRMEEGRIVEQRSLQGG